jgi:cytochrome c oxidase cbb3-type subunit 3
MKILSFFIALVLIVSWTSAFAARKVAAPDPPKGKPVNGLRLYNANCLICHGANGDGKGPYAEKLNPKPRAFTDLGYFERKTDREIYDVISRGGIAKGKSLHMRTWGLRFQTSQISDIVAYIRAVSRDEKINLDIPIGGLDGNTMFQNFCSTCHGFKGKGDGVLSYTLPLKPVDLTSRKFQSQTSDKEILIAIRDSVDRKGIKLSNMPAWGRLMSDEQIKSIVSHIRTLGNP